MTSWPSKDPNAVLDYVYRIALDAGDSIASVASVSFTRFAGTVTTENQTLAAAPNTTSDGYGQDLTVWLSGGVDQETDVFKISWTTVQGRTNDDIITLPVAQVQVPALDLINFTPPVAGNLQQRYSAFTNVPAATIDYWLTDAQRFVTTAWRASDYPIGIMALAAHNMTVNGLVSDPNAAPVAAGVSRFKMGPMEFDLTPQAANAKLAGDFTSTRYGIEYQTLRDGNNFGPRIAPTGLPLDGIWPDIFVAN